MSAERFQNPVLPGFYPDPSVCRVGDEFFLVNSSFAYFPGLPVHRSRDLVNWKPAGHAIHRPGQLDLSEADRGRFKFLAGCRNSLGLWAPTIRHHAGRFWVVCTQVGRGGHFLVHATDPAGPWSDPVWLDQGGIDPSLFWDEDGRCYLLSNLWPSGPRGIFMSEIEPQTGRRLSPVRLLWEGAGNLSPEGPHLYRARGWYYLLTAEGGTGPGHLVACARSRRLWGPYEACPGNPILSHRSLDARVQNAGHGDLVEAADGSWWMVFLGVRPTGYPPRHHLGRETFLAAVEWDAEGWPVVNGGRPVGLEEAAPAFARGGHARIEDAEERDLDGPAWCVLRNPVEGGGCPGRGAASWRLRAGAAGLDEAHGSPGWRGRRLDAWRATASVVVKLDVPDVSAGINLYQSETRHHALSVSRGTDGSTSLRLHRHAGEFTRDDEVVLETNGEAWRLEVEIGPERAVFRAGSEGGEMIEAGSAPLDVLATEIAGGFTGVFVGLHVEGREGAVAEFRDWRYRRSAAEARK